MSYGNHPQQPWQQGGGANQQPPPQQQPQQQQQPPWQWQQQEYVRQQQEAYQRQQQQRGEAPPQWAREENRPEPSDQAHPCFIVPGLICCLVVIALSIVGLSSRQLRFYSLVNGDELGSVTQLKIDFDYLPKNASLAALHIHLSGSDWTSDSTPIGKLGQAYSAQAGIRITCIVLLCLVSIYECLRFTGFHVFRREILAVRMLVAGTVVFVFILEIFGSIIASAVHRNAIPDFVEYIEAQLGIQVAVLSGGGGLLAQGIAIIFLIVLLAFGIRTFVGKRCQSCCCECCGCTLATEAQLVDVEPAPVVMQGVPGTAPHAHPGPVTGMVVTRTEV